MAEMTPADPNGPLMRAWRAYEQTDEYANTRKWALHPDAAQSYIDGSLWAAFEEGFRAGQESARIAFGGLEPCAEGETQCNIEYGYLCSKHGPPEEPE